MEVGEGEGEIKE
jgi:hypothetical protein